MTTFSDSDRLDWVLNHKPEFNDGYLRVWLGSITAHDMGFPCSSAYYMAEGDTPRECLDKAMSGQLERMD